MKHKLTLKLSILFFTLVFFPNLGRGVDIPKDPLKAQPLTEKLQINGLQSFNIRWGLALPEKYHAYQDMFQVKVVSPQEAVQVESFQVKPVVKFYDKFSKKNRLGMQERADLDIKIILKNLNFKNETTIKFDFTYQACTEDFCLLPVHKILEQPIEVTKASSSTLSAADLIGQINVSDLIQSKSLLAFLFVFFAGILTSFTPCIFPMIPITLSILGSQTVGQTKWRGFWISVIYVHGIATTYSLLGILAAQTGSLFGSIMSNAYVISTISFIFILMALSMFDLYEIQIPLFIRSKFGNKKISQNYVGAYISGMITGVVASPCVSPVLVALLAYVAQSQNLFFGLTLLFTYAIGIGMIFIIMGTFSQHLGKLPKSGPWMIRVKRFFGIILILMAAYYMYPITKRWFQMNSTHKVSSSQWQNYSEELFNNSYGKNTIILDFWAEWCEACHELERYTFSNIEVKSKLSSATLLKVNATNETPQVTPLLQKYGIIGLPTIIFIEPDGTVRQDLTLTGYEPPSEFLKRLEKLKITQTN